MSIDALLHYPQPVAQHNDLMKKIFAALVVFMMLITTGFAQQTTVTHKTSHHKYVKHKMHRKHHVANKKHVNNMQSQKPSEGATMNARSGSTSNGAGKSARIQTSTKEKADNLNDMDKSRN